MGLRMVNAPKSWMLHPWITTLLRLDGRRWLVVVLRDEVNGLVVPLRGRGWEEVSFLRLLPSPTRVLLSLRPGSWTPEGERCCTSVVPGCACPKSSHREGTWQVQIELINLLLFFIYIIWLQLIDNATKIEQSRFALSTHLSFLSLFLYFK